MQVHHFALGIRFDLLRATIYDADEHTAGRMLLEEIFSVLTVSDLKGLSIYGGRDTSQGDDFIYMIVIDGGSIKEMRRIFEKLDADAALGMYLSHTMPYMENNRLDHVDGLRCFGKVEKDGSLSGGEVDAFGLTVPLKHGKKRSVGHGIKLLLAPDNFKGSISSADAIKRLTFAARRHFPGVKIVPLPIAYGGAGTVRAMITATGGAYRKAQVTSPLGERITATYGVLRGKVAILEAAEASGTALMAGQDAMDASTFGTGELIRRALEEGLDDIVIGLGDVACCDCGMGCARALGVKFFDESGVELSGADELIRVAKIDTEYLNPLIKSTHFTLICDSSAPFSGDITANLPKELSLGAAHFMALLNALTGSDVSALAGSGEGGGLGAMLMALLSPDVKTGIDALLDTVEFEKLLSGVALVVTGEGRLDEGSSNEETAVSCIMRRCAARNVPVAMITGGMGEGAEKLYAYGNIGIMPTINAPMTLDMALEDAERLFDSAADRMFRFIRMGRDVEKIGAPKVPKMTAYPPELIEENLELARQAVGVRPQKHS